MIDSAVTRAVLLDAAAVERGLGEIAAARRAGRLHAAVDASLPDPLPDAWQVAQAVLRMMHRLVFHAGDVGTSAMPVRAGWRARLLENRALRLPFLLREGSVVPWDLSGLRSPPAVIVRHLVGTHHDRTQALYDLELLAARAPHALVTLRDECLAIVEHRHPREGLLRDLCVFERYHEDLLGMVDDAIGGRFATGKDADDIDISFFAAMRFCARQPKDVRKTLRLARARRWTIRGGLTSSTGAT